MAKLLKQTHLALLAGDPSGLVFETPRWAKKVRLKTQLKAKANSSWHQSKSPKLKLSVHDTIQIYQRKSQQFMLPQ